MFIRSLIIASAIAMLPTAAEASSVQEVADVAERVARKAQQAAAFHDAFEHLGNTLQPKAEKSVYELFNEVFPTKSNASQSK